jgi:hypothetical protein
MTEHDEKWLNEQRCPRCRQPLTNCDWCEPCDLELFCAQWPEGLAVATRGTDPDGTPVLILAAKPAGWPAVD